ncbi:energy-coupling factor transporter transmembrane component T [Citrobacter sp. JGM124]|uniref:energy-coupling factor transporter transmembrane component T n=1 Tax=Citrobacter sp. JGM124 TaxID=2799789 RepID=UPI001BA80367|nr:energy-coupling factor transporter transmembrane component T [Citrobacter sp. JGM124]MBS0847934.1 energy-coupling factor transporter transmembrane protein EcfT [Citrobacter sp. JGM124]
MHPFTSLTIWLWVCASSLFLPLGWPLAALSAASFIALLAWSPARYRWRFVAWLVIPMALGLWMVHSGWLAHWITGAPLDTSRQNNALALWLRLVVIISGAQIWLQLVSTERFIRALFASRLPGSFSYLLAGPLLLVEQLGQQLTHIREAQIARGVPLDGNVWQRFASLPALILPLAGQALSELAVRGAALDLRAFRAVPRRTTLHAPADSRTQCALRYGLLVLILIEGGLRWWW